MELSQQLEDKQVNVQHMQSQSDTLDGDIERLFEIKQKVSQPITRILTSCESADQWHSCILQEILIVKQLIKNSTAFNRAGACELLPTEQ